MDVFSSRHRCFILTLIVAFLLFLLSSSSAASLNRFSGELGERRSEEIEESVLPGQGMDQKRLGSLGGGPSCRNKCMECRPCRPVLVSVQPDKGYYTEAWRCSCHGRLFDP